jgi:hypothetical protein
MAASPRPGRRAAARPFLTIGDVSVWALGNDRFRIESPAGAEEVQGYDEAERRVGELAGRS